MTRDKIMGLAVVAALLIPVIPTFAEVVPEVTFRGGYTDNLFNDSTSTNGSYTAVSPQLKIYPSAAVELRLGGSYTSYYDYSDSLDYSDLSNIAGNAGITYIPTPKESRLAVMLSGSLYGRRYGTLYEPYNYYGASGSVSLSFDLWQNALFRGGGSANITEFPNSVTGDHDGFALFGSLNFTPFGSNSLNIEAGYDLDRYATRVDTTIGGGANGPGGHADTTYDGLRNIFQTLHYSIRYSRPISERVGASATIVQREFVEEASYVVYGFSVDHLSPWSSLWEGWTAGGKIKSFPGKDFIVECGFSHSDKEYVQNLEILSQAVIVNDDTLRVSEYVLEQRSDERANVYISIQRPFSLKSGKLIKPSLQVGYIDNSSTDEFFRYSYFDFNVSLRIRF